ncbi:MAG TPA: sulfotransferase [Candidatus Limnocylindria bacterium]|nr:sulfotransferase [Candidatus Limnocylindria bacterium]
MTRRPNLFIVGAPKSGTTSLYDYLHGHSDVFMSPIKEPIYFAPDMQAGFKHRFRHGEDEKEYLALFDGAHDERYVGEASTRYLASPMAPALIREFAPDARIVAMLRNPVDMVYALHNERVSQQAEDVTDFEAAIALDHERREGRRLPRGSNALGAVYRDNAMFGAQLMRWLDTLGRDHVYVIIFDDFARDTAAEFRRLLDYLGIDPSYRPPQFAVVNKSHRSRGGLARALFASPVAHVVRHSVMPAVIGEDNAARAARRLRHSRINRRANPRPPLDREFRRRLEREFEADVAVLSRLVDRDLSSEWLGKPVAAPA